MAHRMPTQGKVTITVDEYSSNPTQAFTHYNINQSRFQPPHVHIICQRSCSILLCVNERLLSVLVERRG